MQSFVTIDTSFSIYLFQARYYAGMGDRHDTSSASNVVHIEPIVVFLSLVTILIQVCMRLKDGYNIIVDITEANNGSILAQTEHP